MQKSNIYEMLYMNNLHPLYQQIRNEIWGNSEIKMNSFCSLNQLDKFIEWLELKAGTTFADICCGDGTPLIYITQKVQCKSFGLDFNQYSLNIAKNSIQKHNMDIKFINIDLTKEKLPFDNSYINALSCIESIQHFSIQERVNEY